MPEIAAVNVSDYFSGFHPHQLYYGWNGVGKTTFAGKSGLRTLLLDCGDAGVITLRKVPKNLKIIRVKSIAGYFDAIDKAMRLASQIDLLVVDTLTGLQSIAIRETKGKRSFEMNQRKWGQAGSKVIECISETRMFPKDIIYLAQERRKRDPGDEQFEYIAPSLTPGIREQLSCAVDWVGRMYVEDDKRKMSFALSKYVEAKDRAGLFPKVLVNPNYMMIRNRIIEAIK